MVVWFLCEDGRRIRAVDPFVPTCYLAAPPSIREHVFQLLRRASCRISTREVERYELGALHPTPVLEVSVHAPAQFLPLTKQLIRTCPDAVGAKIFYGAKPMVPFQAQVGAEANPTVDFGNMN